MKIQFTESTEYLTDDTFVVWDEEDASLAVRSEVKPGELYARVIINKEDMKNEAKLDVRKQLSASNHTYREVIKNWDWGDWLGTLWFYGMLLYLLCAMLQR